MSAIENDQPVGSGTEDTDDPNLGLFRQLKREILEAHRHRSAWRDEAKECFAFVAGNQWSEEDKNLLREQNRPAVVFNRTAPILKAVCGLEINNRQEVVYLPREMGDVTANEIFTSAGRWVRQECNAEDEESEAFRDMGICGEGWIETRMDYDEDPEGKIIEERIYPLEMGVNKGASRANYKDARIIYRIRTMLADDVRALLGLDPSLVDDALDAKWLDDNSTPQDGGTGFKKDYPDTTRGAVASGRGQGRMVKIVQVQYWERSAVHMVATEEDSQVQEMNDAEFQLFEQRAKSAGIQFHHARTMRKTYYECFIGTRILDKRTLDMGMFQFKAMTGERDEEKKCFYGIVRDMLDPQRWANKFLSQTMNIMNTNAKGGLLAEIDAFQSVTKAEKNWSDPTKIIWMKSGALARQKVKERTPAQLPTGLDNLMMFAISSIRDVTGVNLELLGQADREQAASLEAQRRQSAMTVLATMFNSLRRFRKDQGRLLLHFILLLPDNTLIRVVEQGQVQYVPLIKQDADVSKFDVVIDQAPTSPDQKQFVWAITAQILQMGVLPPPVIVELLKYSPYPESVVAEIRKAMGMDGQMPPEQLQQKLQQAEEALQMLEGQLREAMENAKTVEDDRAVEVMKLELDEYKAETDRLRAQWDARAKLMQLFAPEDQARGDEQVDAERQPLSSPEASNSSNLEAKVDALAGMLQQLMQAIAPPQQMEPVPPTDAIPTQEPPVM